MANNVEERIVAAKFDSSDFEKGVDKTVKKLDELKKSMNFEKTGETLAELGNKTKEAQESASKSLEKLSNSFTSFTGMLKQKLLSGIADRVVGELFKMERGVTNFFRSMSTGQMAAGMQKFESALTSVRMITASTYDEIDAITGKKTGKRLNYTQGQAYESVQKLQDYADETSYSMDQMVDAMSKMVSAGVKLEQAEKNVQGIANACAAAGVNANDAARAFFNLSQAYSSGSLKYTDYRSLQLLNMTNENFEEALLAAGVASGTLVEKKGKNGQSVYKTKKTKKNGKVTAGKTVNRKNLADSLRFNWADNEVMDYLFGNKFFVDVADFQKAKEEVKRKNGGVYNAKDTLAYLKEMEDETGKIDKVTGKVAKKYSELAVNSFMAAREARNLTDVLNAVRDYVSSGWSKIFEKLFGQLETASEFFTQLSEGGIAGIFTGGIDFMDDVLTRWDEGHQGGEAFRRTIIQLDAAVGQLAGIFGDLLPDTNEFGDVLYNMTSDLEFASEQFMRWVESVRKWLNDPDDKGISRIKRIQNAIANLSGVFSIVAKLADIAFSSFSKALTLLEPIFDAIFQGIEKLTEPIGDLGSGKNTGPFDALTDSITNLFNILQPIVEKLGPYIVEFGSILGKIGAFILQMSIDTLTMNIQFFADAIGLLLESFGMASSQQARDGIGVLGGIKNDLQGIVDVCSSGIQTVREFLGVLINDLRTLLGLPAKEGQEAVGEEGGVFAGVKNFFETNEFIKKAELWLSQAKTDIINWFKHLPTTISMLIENLLFEKSTELVQEGSAKGAKLETVQTAVATPLKIWLDGAVDAVSTFIAELPKNVLAGIGTAVDFIGMVIDTIFGRNKEGEKAETKNEDQTVTAIQEWANTFSTKFQKEIQMLPLRIRMYIRIYSRKMKATWKEFKKWFNESDTMKTIKSWGQSLVEEFKKFVVNLPETLKGIIKSAGAIGRNIIDVIKSIFSADETKAAAESEIDKAFKSINLQSVLDTIADLGKEIANQFLSWFTGSEDMDANFKWIGEKVSKLIESIPDAIQGAIGWVTSQLGELWEKLYDALMGTGANGVVKDDSELKKKLEALTDPEKGTLIVTIKDLPGLLKATFDDACKLINALWDKLLSAITGNGGKQSLPDHVRALLKDADVSSQLAASIRQAYNPDEYDYSDPSSKSKWQQFAEDLGDTIISVFQELPGWILDGINKAIETISNTFSQITDAMSKALEDDDPVEAVTKVLDPEAKGNTQDSELTKTLKKVGSNLTNLISTILPKFISTGFELIKFKAGEWRTILIEAFESVNSNEELKKSIEDIGTAIEGWIKGIPSTIQNAIGAAKIAIQKFFGVNKDGLVGSWQTIAPDTKKGLDNTGTEVEKEVDNSTLWETIQSVADKIGAAFKTAFDSLWPQVSSWFASLPEHIVDGLNAAFSSIDGAIADVGDWFNKHLTATSEGDAGPKKAAEEAIANATAQAEAGVKAASDETKPAPFVVALEGLGATIWKCITETIPGTISSAFNWVRINWNKEGGWFDSLKNIFSSVTGISAEDLSFDNAFSFIKTIIFEKLPGIIVNGIKDVKTNSKRWIAAIYNLFQDEDHQIKPENISFSGIIEAVKTALLNLPGEIIKTVEQIKNKFFKKELPENFKKAYEEASSSFSSQKYMLETWDKQGYDVSSLKKDTNFIGGFIEFGKSIGGAINEGLSWAIKNIGPIITDGWSNTLEIINGLLASLSSWFMGDIKDSENDIGKHLEDNFKGETSEPLRKSLDNIGHSIVDLFRFRIPEFLGTAVGQLITWVPDIVDSFIHGLTTALGNNLNDGLSGLITKVETDAKESIEGTDSINLEEELIKKLMTDPEGRDYYDWLNSDKWQRARINDDRIKAGLEAFVEADTKALGEKAQKLLDNPKMYETLLQYFSLPENDERRLWIKNGLIDANVTEKTIEEYGKIMGAVEKMSIGHQAIQGAETIASGVGGVLETLFHTAFSFDEKGNVNGLSIVSWIGIGAVLVTKICELLSMIKDVPRITSTERLEAQNSMAGVLHTAMVTLMAGMAFATVVSQMNTTQFDQAMTAFDKIGGLVEKIVGWYGAVNLVKGVGDLASTIGALLNKTPAATYNISTGAGGLVAGGLISAAVATIESTIGTIGGNIRSLSDAISDSVGIMTEAAGNIDTAIGFMDSTIELLKRAQTISGYYGDVISAKAVLDEFSPSLGLFVQNTSTRNYHTTQAVNALEQIMDMTEKMDAFAEWASKEGSYFNTFKYAISSLGSALSLLSGSGTTVEINESLINGTVKFLKAILGDDELVGLAKKITPDNFGTDALGMQEAMECLIIFATALGRLGVAAKEMKGVDGSDISSFFTEVAKITLPAQLGSGSDVTSLAEMMINLGSGLSKLGEGAGTLTDDGVTLATRALDMLGEIALVTKNFKAGFLDAFFAGGGDIGNFGGAISGIGSNLASFFNSISPYVGNGKFLSNNEALTGILSILNQLGVIAYAARGGDFTGITQSLSNDFADRVVTFVTKISEATITDDAIDKTRRLVQIIKELFTGFGQLQEFIMNSDALDGLAEKIFKVTLVDPLNKFDGQKYERVDGSIITAVVDSIKYITNELGTGETIISKLESAKLVFGMMQDLLSGLASLFTGQNVISLKGISDYSFISTMLNETLTYMTTNFSLFSGLFDQIDTISADKLEKAKLLFSSIYDLGKAMSVFAVRLRILNETDTSVSEGLWSLEAFDFDLLKTVIEKFLTAYDEALNDERVASEVRSSGVTMAMLLYEGIQEAFENPDPESGFHPKITPVLDDTLLRSQLSALFGIENPQDFNFGTAFSDAVQRSFVNSELNWAQDYTATLNEINGKLDRLENLNKLDRNFSDITSSLASAKVVIDKEQMAFVLTPLIDRNLADMGYISLNHAAT